MASVVSNLRSNPERVVEGEDSPVVGNDSIATKAWKCWKLTRDHLSQWRTEAAEAYDLVAGHQWTSDEQAVLREQLRPIVTFNRTSVIIDSVAGYQINNRQDVSYQPRTVEDAGPVQVESEAARYFRGQCDAEDEETDAFGDTLVTGMGCVEHRMNYDDDPNGMLAVDRVDILEMGYDPNAKKRNLVDRRWDIRGKWWDRMVAKQTFPDHEFGYFGGIMSDDDELLERQPIDRMAAFFYRDTGAGQVLDRHKDSVFILEYTWFEMKPFLVALNPATQSMEEADRASVDALNRQLEMRGQPPVRTMRQQKKVFKRAFIYGPDTLNLDDLDAPCPTQFHYNFMTGKRDRNKNVWFGLGRLMKDPQRWANKFFSQTMHMLNANAKGMMIHEQGAFADPSRIETQMAKPGARIEVEQGYFEKVRFEQASQIPPDIFKLTEFAIGSVRDTTGVNVEMLGQTQREQPGVVENLRKQSAMAILATFFDALRRYHKAAGRLTLYFITTYMSDGRLVRVIGPTGAKYVPLTHKKGFAEYDIVVDESPTSTNSREGFWAILMQVLPLLLQAGLPIPPDVLDYVPNLPASLAEKWKGMLVPNPQTAQEKEQAKQMLLQKHSAEVQDLQAGAASKMAKARVDAARVQLESATQSVETQNTMADTAVKTSTAQLNVAKAGMVPHEATMDAMQMLHEMWRDVQELKQAQQALQQPQGAANG